MDIFCKDRRLNISANYLKPRFAYGGSCLPRDVAVLNSLSRRQRLKSPLLAALASSNEAQKGRLLRLIKKLKKKRIGFLGITFKAGTDDLRNSPVLEVMRLLLRGGYGLSAFDEAIDARKLIGINKIHLERIIPRYKEILAGDIDAVLAGADLLVLNHNPGAATIKKIRLFLRRKRVIDLACVPELAKSRNYIGFNW
jgi:GDP-mannose 6-dehydrogenase